MVIKAVKDSVLNRQFLSKNIGLVTETHVDLLKVCLHVVAYLHCWTRTWDPDPVLDSRLKDECSNVQGSGSR